MTIGVFLTYQVRLQVQGSKGMEARYRGMVHCFFDIVKTESVAMSERNVSIV